MSFDMDPQERIPPLNRVAMTDLEFATKIIDNVEKVMHQTAEHVPGATPEFVKLHREAVTVACRSFRKAMPEILRQLDANRSMEN